MPTTPPLSDYVNEFESAYFDAVVQAMLGLGLSADLIAEVISLEPRHFRNILHLKPLPPIERRAPILKRMQSSISDFRIQLELAISSDDTNDIDNPTMNIDTGKPTHQFKTRAVINIFENPSFQSRFEHFKDLAIQILKAERAFPLLDENSAIRWLAKTAWSVQEFAALSLGRLPHIGTIPIAPRSSGIALIIDEYIFRLDQLTRAVALGARPLHKADTDRPDISEYNTPMGSILWAKRHNIFQINSLLMVRAPAKYPDEQLKAFLTILDSVAREAQRTKIKGKPDFRYRKADFLDLVAEVFPHMSNDDYEELLWRPLDKSIAGKGGNMARFGDWNRIKMTIKTAWVAQARD